MRVSSILRNGARRVQKLLNLRTFDSKSHSIVSRLEHLLLDLPGIGDEVLDSLIVDGVRVG